MWTDLRGDNLRRSSSESDPEAGSGPRVGTYDEIAHQLTDGFWGYRAGPHYDAAPGSTVNGDADITFHDDEGGIAHGGYGSVTIPANLLAEHGATLDAWTFSAYIHEIGHALGLGHPGDYPRDFENPSAAYPDEARFLNDSEQVSVMSYFSQAENSHVDASFAWPVTPMIVDIIAVHDLYGVPLAVNPGDTVYGYGSNAGGYLGRLFGALSGEEPDSDVYAGGPVALTIYVNHLAGWRSGRRHLRVRA